MSVTNGAPTSARDQLREARRQLALAETEVRLRQARQTLRLIESSSWSDNWIGAVNGRLFRHTSDPDFTGAATWHDRRFGRYFPVFQSEIELAQFRQLSRIEMAINPYAQGLVGGVASYMLGTGCTYRAVCDNDEDVAVAVQKIVDTFLDRNQWFGGEQPGLEQELFERSQEDGEFFLLTTPNEDGSVDVRTIEPEQVTQPPGSDEREYKFGIRTPDDDVQMHEAYWVQWGDSLGDGQEYPVNRMTHYRRGVKRSIKRGLPLFTFSTLDAIRVANKLGHNIGVGAYVQASYSVVRQHDTATQSQVVDMRSALAEYTQTNPISGDTEYHQRYEPGVKDIPRGLNYIPPPSASNTGGHIEALHAQLRRAGLPWNAPEWLSTASGSDMAAYTASLTAESPFIRRIKERQGPLAQAFRRPVLYAIEQKIRAQGLRVFHCERDGAGKPTSRGAERVYSWEEIRRRVDVLVQAPSPEQHNQLDEANRRQIEKLNGVLSPQTWMQAAGYDVDVEIENMQKYLELTGGQGLALPVPKDEPPSAGGETEQAEPGAPPAEAPAQEARTLREAAGPVLLDLPDTRQQSDYSCGAAALQAVFSYFGVSGDEAALRQVLGTEPTEGTAADQMAVVARRAGLVAEFFQGMTLDTVRGHLDAGRPVILVVLAYGTGHYVVAIGYDGQRFTLHDPAAGRVEWLAEELLARWVYVGEENVSVKRAGVVIGKSSWAKVPAASEARTVVPAASSTASPAIHVHVAPAPAPVFNMSSEIIVPVQEASAQALPVVNVTVPQAAAPVIHVLVPAQPPPVVNVQPPKVILKPEINVEAANVTVAPQIDVHVPEPKPIERIVERDAKGRVDRIVERPQE